MRYQLSFSHVLLVVVAVTGSASLWCGGCSNSSAPAASSGVSGGGSTSGLSSAQVAKLKDDIKYDDDTIQKMQADTTMPAEQKPIASAALQKQRAAAQAKLDKAQGGKAQ